MDNILYFMRDRAMAEEIARRMELLAKEVRRARSTTDLRILRKSLHDCMCFIEREEEKQHAATIRFAAQPEDGRECSFHGSAFSKICQLCRDIAGFKLEAPSLLGLQCE